MFVYCRPSQLDSFPLVIVSRRMLERGVGRCRCFSRNSELHQIQLRFFWPSQTLPYREELVYRRKITLVEDFSDSFALLARSELAKFSTLPLSTACGKVWVLFAVQKSISIKCQPKGDLSKAIEFDNATRRLVRWQGFCKLEQDSATRAKVIELCRRVPNAETTETKVEHVKRSRNLLNVAARLSLSSC